MYYKLVLNNSIQTPLVIFSQPLYFLCRQSFCVHIFTNSVHTSSSLFMAAT